MKKIFINGAGGMLGEAFYLNFKEKYELKCTDIDVNEKWLEYLDVNDSLLFEEQVKNFKPDYLFHLAALTNLEYCEKNLDETYNTNTLSVENAVNIANQLNIPLLFISTAGIFNGDKEFYDDWDLPNPIGTYAKSKYYAEIYVRENANKYFICRAGWMMGGGPKKDKKFINILMKQIKNGAKEIYIVNDKGGTPTYTHDFSKTVFDLIGTNYFGLYNMVCRGLTTRLEVAKEMLKILDLETKVKINPVDSNHFKDLFSAPRPNNECLINRKLTYRNLNNMPDWKVSLKLYLNDYFGSYL